MPTFIRFKPLNQERVWGGRALETKLGRALPPGRPIGESWEIVDRPEAQSVVDGGEYDGLTLRELLQRHGTKIMGPRWPAEKPFPILVKWLDCRERLSLQVHPPATVAASLGGEPKTENWYVAAAEPGADLILGLRPGVTKEKFEKAIADGTLEECVNQVPVTAGDSVLVRSGQVHAIGAGNLILEIQQNSDTTYRVYDWGRVGLDGKPRQLHVKESLQSILWNARPPKVFRGTRLYSFFDRFLPGCRWALLVRGPEFRVFQIQLKSGDRLCRGSFRLRLNVHPIGGDGRPRIVSVIKGRLTSASGDLTGGDNVLLPSAARFVFTAAEDSAILVTDGLASSNLRREYAVDRFLGRLYFGRGGREGDEFTDRCLLRLSVIGLALSLGLVAGQAWRWPRSLGIPIVLVYGWTGSPTFMLLSAWEIIRHRRTWRAMLAAGISIIGTSIIVAVSYYLVTSRISLSTFDPFLHR